MAGGEIDIDCRLRDLSRPQAKEEHATIPGWPLHSGRSRQRQDTRLQSVSRQKRLTLKGAEGVVPNGADGGRRNSGADASALSGKSSGSGALHGWQQAAARLNPMGLSPFGHTKHVDEGEAMEDGAGDTLGALPASPTTSARARQSTASTFARLFKRDSVASKSDPGAGLLRESKQAADRESKRSDRRSRGAASQERPSGYQRVSSVMGSAIGKARDSITRLATGAAPPLDPEMADRAAAAADRAAAVGSPPAPLGRVKTAGRLSHAAGPSVRVPSDGRASQARRPELAEEETQLRPGRKSLVQTARI